MEVARGEREGDALLLRAAERDTGAVSLGNTGREMLLTVGKALGEVDVVGAVEKVEGAYRTEQPSSSSMKPPAEPDTETVTEVEAVGEEEWEGEGEAAGEGEGGAVGAVRVARVEADGGSVGAVRVTRADTETLAVEDVDTEAQAEEEEDSSGEGVSCCCARSVTVQRTKRRSASP